MPKKNLLTKTLAVVGAALVWFPLLAPVLLSLVVLLSDRVLHFDYLMPAELSPAALLGGILLIGAAFRARSRQRLIGGSLVLAFGLLVGGQLLAVATGLASGATEPTGWPWLLVLGALAGYVVALAAVAVGGLLLARDLLTTNH